MTTSAPASSPNTAGTLLRHTEVFVASLSCSSGSALPPGYQAVCILKRLKIPLTTITHVPPQGEGILLAFLSPQKCTGDEIETCWQHPTHTKIATGPQNVTPTYCSKQTEPSRADQQHKCLSPHPALLIPCMQLSALSSAWCPGLSHHGQSREPSERGKAHV